MRPRQRFFERPGERVQARFLLAAGALAGSSGGKKGGGGSGGGGAGSLRRFLDAQIALQQQQFAREEPFYQAAQRRSQFQEGFLPQFAETVRNPTENPYYNLVAREGLNQLRNNFSVTGSPSSGAAQIVGGRFMAGLEADQLNRMFDRLSLASGIGSPPIQTPFSQGLALEPSITNAATQLAQIRSSNMQAANQQAASTQQGLFGLGSSALGALASYWMSTEAVKEDIKPIEKKAHERMLDELMKVPVYTWKYKKGVRDGDYHVGTTVEKAPLSIRGKDGVTLDPINYFGMLTLGYQDLSKKVKKLEKR